MNYATATKQYINTLFSVFKAGVQTGFIFLDNSRLLVESETNLDKDRDLVLRARQQSTNLITELPLNKHISVVLLELWSDRPHSSGCPSRCAFHPFTQPQSSSTPRFASPLQQLPEQGASLALSVHHTAGKNKEWSNSSQLTSGEVSSDTRRAGNCTRWSKAENSCSLWLRTVHQERHSDPKVSHYFMENARTDCLKMCITSGHFFSELCHK